MGGAGGAKIVAGGAKVGQRIKIPSIILYKIYHESKMSNIGQVPVITEVSLSSLILGGQLPQAFG